MLVINYHDKNNDLISVVSPNISTENTFYVKLTDAVYYAYANLLIDRQSRGDMDTSFSRRDYNKYKKKEDPSVSTIERHLHGWGNVAKILPIEDVSFMKHLRKPQKGNFTDLSFTEFYDILDDIASSNDKNSILDITAKEYREYAKENEIPDWRTFAGRMNTHTWKESVRFAYEKHIKKDDENNE